MRLKLDFYAKSAGSSHGSAKDIANAFGAWVLSGFQTRVIFVCYEPIREDLHESENDKFDAVCDEDDAPFYFERLWRCSDFVNWYEIESKFDKYAEDEEPVEFYENALFEASVAQIIAEVLVKGVVSEVVDDDKIDNTVYKVYEFEPLFHV